MTIATAEQLADHGALCRQLRDIKGLVEKRTGVFEAQGRSLVELHAVDGKVVALLRGRHGDSRYAIGAAAEQRRLIDDARRRVLKLDED